MNQYSSYKDSGVEWIGEIPSGWEFLKLWLIIKSTELGGNYYSSTENDGTPLMKMGNIDRGKINLRKIEYVDEQYDESHILKFGDFLFNTRNSVDLVGKVCVWRNELEKSLFNSNILRINFKDSVNVEFINYQFNSQSILDILKLISKGTTSVSGIYYKDLSKIEIILPPLSEQHQIVSYLDNKTSSIDSLIQSKEKKIELLKEKRTSLINQVVTKGLNPDVEMKDSGVEWIGEIPREWEVKKLYTITHTINNGFVGPTRDIMKYEGVKYIQGIHIKEGKIKYTPNGPYYVSKDWVDNNKKSIIHEGDVLLVQTGSVGEVGYVDREFDNSSCHGLIIIRLIKDYGYGKFLTYFFLSQSGQNYLNLIRTGEILFHLNTKKVKYGVVPLPPLNEQQEIVSYLDKETKLIDETISSEQKKIELLKEYKQSLISEVVTGKRKVVLN